MSTLVWSGLSALGGLLVGGLFGYLGCAMYIDRAERESWE